MGVEAGLGFGDLGADFVEFGVAFADDAQVFLFEGVEGAVEGGEFEFAGGEFGFEGGEGGEFSFQLAFFGGQSLDDWHGCSFGGRGSGYVVAPMIQRMRVVVTFGGTEMRRGIGRKVGLRGAHVDRARGGAAK